MIIRGTQKLFKKLKINWVEIPTLDKSKNPFTDWSANIFRAERTQYVIVSNTFSLFSVIYYGAGISDDDRFINHSFAVIREICEEIGCSDIYFNFITPFSGHIKFSKIGDRAVNGSIVDLIHMSKHHILYQDLSPDETALKINEVPMSYLKYKTPIEAFKAMKF
jgi:hypothetical protein